MGIEFSAVMERRGFVDGMLLMLVMVSLLVGSSEGLPILADDSLQGAPARQALVQEGFVGVSVKSCKELGWFSPYPGRVTSDKVCGASDKIKGGCAGSREYDSAKSICEADGGRLCSMEELEGMATAGTGCGYDEQRVWTGSACGAGAYFTMAGQSDLYGAEYPKECTAKDASNVYVRCCADAHDDSESQAEATASASEEQV